MQTVTGDLGFSSSAAVNYLKSMTDLLDFRKPSGVTDAVLRSFADEKQHSNLLSTINSNNMLFDQSVVGHTEKLLGSSANAISAVTDEDQPENTTWTPNENSGGSVEAPSTFPNMDECVTTSTQPLAPFNSNDVAFQKLPDYANVVTFSPNSPSLLLDHGLISDTKNLCASYSTNDATASSNVMSNVDVWKLPRLPTRQVIIFFRTKYVGYAVQR